MKAAANNVMVNSLCQVLSSTTATAGTVIDLANYTNVGKHAIKLSLSVTDCKLTTTTDQTIGVLWYESDSSAGTSPSALSGAAISSGTTKSTYAEANVLVSKRYIFAQATAAGTATAWGVVANAFPLRRDF